MFQMVRQLDKRPQLVMSEQRLGPKRPTLIPLSFCQCVTEDSVPPGLTHKDRFQTQGEARGQMQTQKN